MRAVLLVALVLAAAPSAQTAPEVAAGEAHRLPFASRGHVIELAVGGATSPVVVRVASAPPWLAFAASEAAAVAGEGPEPVARLAFDVGDEAPAGEAGAVVLEVVGTGGTVLATHAVAVEVSAPERLSVSAARPNPSRGRSEVTVAVPSAGRVRVSVVDVLGREVAVALDAERAAGGHVVAVEAGRLSSGVYVVGPSPAGVRRRRA